MMGHDRVRAVNELYRRALRSEVECLEDGLLLTDRQRTVLDMYYHRKRNRGFIADTLGASQTTVSRELAEIRSKLEEKRRG